MKVHRSLSRPSLWGRLTQVSWVLLTLFVFYVLVFKMRTTIEQTATPCARWQDCQLGQVPSDQARLLTQTGLPLNSFGVWTAILQALFDLMYVVVAGLLIWRRPNDRMVAFSSFTLVLFGGVTINGNNTRLPQGAASLLQGPFTILSFLGAVAIVLFLLLFPNGKPVLRWPFIVIGPYILINALQDLAPGVTLTSNMAVGAVAELGTFITVVYVQFYRYRLVSTQAERQQTKWIVYGVAFSLLGFFLMLGVLNVPMVHDTLILLLLATTALFLTLLLIPLSIGFAMLRYRLWDVDVLVKRTVVYALLTASLVAVYVIAVVALQFVLQVVARQGSGLAVGASTLAVAALFQPLRGRIQRFIDGRFYRGPYNAHRTLTALSERLRDEVELDQLTADIVSVVRETMQPSHVSMWLRTQGQ